MEDAYLFYKQFQCQWVIVLLFENEGTWEIISTRFYNKFGRDFCVINRHISVVKFNVRRKYSPRFWENLCGLRIIGIVSSINHIHHFIITMLDIRVKRYYKKTDRTWNSVYE